MRITVLFMLLMLAVACGKDGSSDSKNKVQAQQYDLMWNDRQYEVKDATIDVPATVDGSSIVFKSTATKTDAGDVIKCTVHVNAGETYYLSLSGNTLILQTNQGRRDLRKVNSFSAGGVYGVWSYEEKTEVGSFEWIYSINPTHVVITKKCEG